MSIAIGDQVDFLFKKALGYPETNIVSALAAEKGYFSKPNIFTFQQMAQEFPQTRLSNSDFILTTSPTDITVSNVYRHKSYPYIVKYENLTLESAVSGSSNSFYSPYLKNLISPSLTDDGFYNYIIYTNDMANIITGDIAYVATHVLDADSGVLFFFTYPSYSGTATVNSAQPPKITFYRYQGLTGNVGIASLQEF
jgi:hypothetical protein